MLKATIVNSIFFITATLAWAQVDVVDKGEKVFVDKKCIPCHAVKGKGGIVGPTARGPDLDMVGAQRDAPWLRMFLKDPKAINPKSKMMAFKGTEEELEALVAYLGSLK
jgi:mono/diheme cytochrome c family protein